MTDTVRIMQRNPYLAKRAFFFGDTLAILLPEVTS